MQTYPVTYEADFAEDRSRLHTFFRFLTVIPVGFVLYLLTLGAIITLPVAWIAMVITGRYLPLLYAYHAGLLRGTTRVHAYGMLVTDAYPPFGLDEEPAYPVRVALGGPLPAYDRLKALVRLILLIPVAIIAYLLMIVAEIATVVSWFAIVITGRQLPPLQSAINMGLAYGTRAAAYFLLLTEQWPPPADIDMALEPRAPAPVLPEAPMSSAAGPGLTSREHN
jgi:hypothetical protein